MNEYLKLKGNEELVGKRAKFKNRNDYVKKCWGKEGTIINYEGSKWLSLKFDKPLESGFNDGGETHSLFISPDSIEFI